MSERTASILFISCYLSDGFAQTVMNLTNILNLRKDFLPSLFLLTPSSAYTNLKYLPLRASGFLWLHFEEKMGPNLPWNECNPSINYKEKQVLLPYAMHKPWQEIKYKLSSSLTNHSLDIPSPFIFDHQGSSLSSLVTHELDNQNQNTPCSSLNYQNPIPPSSSYLINHRNTISNSSSYIEVLDGLSTQNSISSTSSCLTSCNYNSTSSHKISDNGWNENKIYQEQEMELDQKSFQLSGTDLDESFTSVTLSSPNMMLSSENVLQQYPESLSYNQQLFQSSQLQQQKMMGVMDANFSYFGSAMLNTGFTESEGSFATPTQVDQINKFPEKPIIYKNRERKQKRMIKNRESAARSRAKKQAHIEYLEKECKRLKKNQDRLKKELVFDQPIPTPKYQLRRTSSI